MTKVALAILCSLTVCVVPSSGAEADESNATLEFRLAQTEQASGWEKKKIRGEEQWVFVSDRVVLKADQIDKVCFYNDESANPVVGFTLTDAGAKAMEEATSQNLRKRLAILLNDEVVSAPTIRSTIRKEGVITGRFEKADLLAFFRSIVLRELP
jgi:preprotein translocase subunit SecD